MARVPLEQAYPALSFRPRSRSWWARFSGQPAECVHLEIEHGWMATLVPDTRYLQGKGSPVRQPVRPEVSLCRACLLEAIEPELAAYAGRVVAFEPDAEVFSQYFFVSSADFAAAGLREEVGAAVAARLKGFSGGCEKCPQPALWLWLPRAEVASLDEVEAIAQARGRRLCAAHGAAALCHSLLVIPEANLFYLNLPYEEAGAYVWI